MTSNELSLPGWTEEIFNVKYLTPSSQEFVVPETWGQFYVESVKISQDQIKSLCKLTLNQSQSKLWRTERKTRITASRAHKILRARSDHKRIEYFLDHKSLEHIHHVRRGIELEPVALKKYHELFSYEISKVGMVVKDQQFWLAASPDAIFKNSQGDICVLEIKCPESLDVPWLTDSGELKKKDQYYTQIQITMYVCNATSADLFIYTVTGNKVVHVAFDQQFC